MNEDLLQYIWRHKLYDPKALKLTNGSTLEVIHPGEFNTDAGPDFFNSRLKIDGTLWAGNVEVHINADDWLKHKHQTDEAYENIILHVVLNNNHKLFDKSGSGIPTLELQKYISRDTIKRYNGFIDNKTNLPCESHLTEVNSLMARDWLQRQAISRLEHKSGDIERLLKLTRNNWEEVLYVKLSRSMGFKVNAEPMEQLAFHLPYNLLLGYSNKLLDLEALLFGVAGLLKKPNGNEYAEELLSRFKTLQRKHKLEVLPAHIWKFSRTRPQNFPTLRIAQFAAFLNHNKNLFSKIIEHDEAKNVRGIFEFHLSPFWQKHYGFELEAKQPLPPQLSKQTQHQVMINAIIPLAFVYGKARGLPQISEGALESLSNLPTEQNKISKKFSGLKLNPATALESQGMLYLHENYCNKKRCLHCAIGSHLLKNG